MASLTHSPVTTPVRRSKKRMVPKQCIVRDALGHQAQHSTIMPAKGNFVLAFPTKSGHLGGDLHSLTQGSGHLALHEGHSLIILTRGEGKMWYEDEDEEDEGRCSGHTMHNSSRSRGGGCSSSTSEIGTPEMETVMLMSTPVSSPPLTTAQPPALMHSIPSRCRSGTCDLPRNLYEAAPGLLGMGSPTCTDHIRNLHHHYNVKVVINLRENPNSDDWFEGLPVRSVHLPVPGYCAPSMETVLAVLRLCELVHAGISDTSESGDDDSEENGEGRSALTKRGAVAVHCLEGKGRTGTVCAAYLLYKRPELGVEEAIAFIRAQSPLSIESSEQEEFLHRFANLRRQMKAEADGESFLIDASSVNLDDVADCFNARGRNNRKHLPTRRPCLLKELRRNTPSSTPPAENRDARFDNDEDCTEDAGWYC